MNTAELDQQIIKFIQAEQPPNESAFNVLALRIFEYQFQNNPIFQRLCENRGRTPADTDDWRQIPSVPTDAFKATDFCAFPLESTIRTFRSSGTTHQDRSRHHLDTLALYEASLLPNFEEHMLPDRLVAERQDYGLKLPLLCLLPSATSQPDSSLTHMIQVAMDRFGAEDSDYFFNAESSFECERLVQALDGAARTQRPVMLLGAAFSFVHLLEECQRLGRSFELPNGSRLMETGGYKGKTREIPRAELHQMLAALFNIPDTHIVNEYGMSEISVQFYDVKLKDTLEGREPRDFKAVPHWSRVSILDPETMEATEGEGLIQICDLSNRGSALHVLTADWGIKREEGFEVFGRAPGAVSKGCSLTLDELLTNN
ncbi:MAG: hypothetical protein QGF00_27245 [Planctomycetota bacterium]|jgi:hypothetical protein|nr:hypothetical protein [Planctomycetota bacterium]MDP7253325.1 hypothetical protein [Planctomycetota bacterium]